MLRDLACDRKLMCAVGGRESGPPEGTRCVCCGCGSALAAPVVADIEADLRAGWPCALTPSRDGAFVLLLALDGFGRLEVGADVTELQLDDDTEPFARGRPAAARRELLRLPSFSDESLCPDTCCTPSARRCVPADECPTGACAAWSPASRCDDDFAFRRSDALAGASASTGALTSAPSLRAALPAGFAAARAPAFFLSLSLKNLNFSSIDPPLLSLLLDARVDCARVTCCVVGSANCDVWMFPVELMARVALVRDVSGALCGACCRCAWLPCGDAVLELLGDRKPDTPFPAERRPDVVPGRAALDDVTGACDVVFVADLVKGEGSLQEQNSKSSHISKSAIKFQTRNSPTLTN